MTARTAPPLVRIGDIEIWAVLDGHMTVAQPPGFPEEDDPEFAVHAEYLHNGRWHLDIGGFLVRTGDRVVLVDAGSGPGDGEPFVPTADESDPALLRWAADNGHPDPEAARGVLRTIVQTDLRTGSFGASLAALGFRPDDITDVLLSHLHFDHIGWLSVDGRPYFPNAVVRCERHDAEYFLAPDFDDGFYRVLWNAMPTSERMAPVLAQFEPWDEDAAIAPGLDCVYAPGHTPGSAIFAITSGSERALILGDSVHCPQELMDPEFYGGGVDVAQADATRERIRRDAEDGATLLSAPHFPRLQFGRLRVGDRPRRWHFEWVPS